MKTLRIVAIALAVIIVVLLGTLFFVKPAKSPTAAQDLAGGLLSSDGHLRVISPIGGPITSPLVINGLVTGGGWFFEASFPVKVIDADGTVLGSGIAMAQPEEQWMSTGTVIFSATVTFKTPHSGSGTIVLSKDNPSGLPKNDESVVIPVELRPGLVITQGVVKGRVELSPTCPVESIPPSPQCAPKPYETSISISKNIQNPESSVFKTVQTDAFGEFELSLPIGEYDFFHAQGNSPYPRCEEKVVTVTGGDTANITINCDTGIR